MSEQIIFTAPRVSTAGSFLTMAFIFDILVTPIERTIATIATSPSGIAATARLIAVISISIQFLPCKSPITNISPQIAIAMYPNVFPSLSSFTCNGVSVFSSSSSILAILPISVSIAVATTTPSPLP